MHKITKEQEEFLNEYTNGTWKLNQKTGWVDVIGDFDCSNKDLSDFLGIEFGSIGGYFDCSHNKLVSLKGAPKKVGESFYCYDNQLVSLEGAPRNVGGHFDCSNNQLVSLEGAPQEIGGDFDCYHNNLVSLEGAPRNVGGDFDCSHNKLVSLEGAPQKVGWNLTCDAITLRGCPINLLGKINFYRRDNQRNIRLENLAKGITDGLAPDIYLNKMI